MTTQCTGTGSWSNRHAPKTRRTKMCDNTRPNGDSNNSTATKSSHHRDHDSVDLRDRDGEKNVCVFRLFSIIFETTCWMLIFLSRRIIFDCFVFHFLHWLVNRKGSKTAAKQQVEGKLMSSIAILLLLIDTCRKHVQNVLFHMIYTASAIGCDVENNLCSHWINVQRHTLVWLG